MWERLPADIRASAGAGAGSRLLPIRLATLCSGSDGPVVAFRAACKCAGLEVEHVFSCESDVRKRKWITAHFPDLTRLYNDVHDVGRGRGLNTISGVLEDVPSDIDVVIVGFCCQDVSFDNPSRSSSALGVASGSGRTGGTFASLRPWRSTMTAPREGSVVATGGYLFGNLAGGAKRVGGDTIRGPTLRRYHRVRRPAR